MDKQVETIIAEYEQRAADESRLMQDLAREEISERIDEFLLPVGRDTGVLLNILARENQSSVILEIGTSYGYSTLWLAAAARETGGRVITLEVNTGKIKAARDALSRAGLLEHVDFRAGDALESIRDLKGKVDFVLLDLWKKLYLPCFELFYPKLRHGAIVVADNMIFPAGAKPETQAYQQALRARKEIESVLVPVGSGLEISRFVGKS